MVLPLEFIREKKRMNKESCQTAPHRILNEDSGLQRKGFLFYTRTEDVDCKIGFVYRLGHSR